ncbi:MAG: hypothetical protein ACPLSA_05985, partial [Caldanaerobacter sp.]
MYHSRRRFVGLIIIMLSFLVFVLCVYVPANERYRWLYPLGWDAPAYIWRVQMLKIKGYPLEAFEELHPLGAHAVLMLL